MDNPGNTGRKDKSCVVPTTTCILNVKWKFAEVIFLQNYPFDPHFKHRSNFDKIHIATYL